MGTSASKSRRLMGNKKLSGRELLLEPQKTDIMLPKKDGNNNRPHLPSGGATDVAGPRHAFTPDSLDKAMNLGGPYSQDGTGNDPNSVINYNDFDSIGSKSLSDENTSSGSDIDCRYDGNSSKRRQSLSLQAQYSKADIRANQYVVNETDVYSTQSEGLATEDSGVFDKSNIVASSSMQSAPLLPTVPAVSPEPEVARLDTFSSCRKVEEPFDRQNIQSPLDPVEGQEVSVIDYQDVPWSSRNVVMCGLADNLNVGGDATELTGIELPTTERIRALSDSTNLRPSTGSARESPRTQPHHSSPRSERRLRSQASSSEAVVMQEMKRSGVIRVHDVESHRNLKSRQLLVELEHAGLTASSQAEGQKSPGSKPPRRLEPL